MPHSIILLEILGYDMIVKKQRPQNTQNMRKLKKQISQKKIKKSLYNLNLLKNLMSVV